MSRIHVLSAPVAALAALAVLAVPAAAAPANATRSRSPIEDSQHSRSRDLEHHATGKVYVPSAAMRAGHPATPAALPPTWPTHPQAIVAPSATKSMRSSGFDTGSAGIGAAAGIGAFAIALAGLAMVRRRRATRSPSGAIS